MRKGPFGSPVRIVGGSFLTTAEQAVLERYYCPGCRAVFRTAFTRCPLDGAPLQWLSADPLRGSDFADRYIIEECIGEGAMGRVYRARHRRVSRRFAVKVLFGDHAADAKMQSRFAREAEAASRLDHPNVISVIDFGETDEGLLYLVMPFVEGRSLSSLIRREAPLSTDRVVSLLRQLCLGLAHAHDRGLIHRDFKADNVIVTYSDEGERPKIVDFGIAMMLESKKGHKLTTEGMVLGTPAVMSPEQASGDAVDHRTDLFALGVVLYEMLSGVLPFEGTPLEIARHNLVSSAPRIAQRVPGLDVDPTLEEISHRLMAKQAESRFQSSHEVVQAVDHAFAGLNTPLPGSLTTPTPGSASRTPSAPFASGEVDRQGVGVAETIATEAMPAQRKWTFLAFGLLGLAAVAIFLYAAGVFGSNDAEVASAVVEETEAPEEEPAEEAAGPAEAEGAEGAEPAPAEAITPEGEEEEPASGDDPEPEAEISGAEAEAASAAEDRAAQERARARRAERLRRQRAREMRRRRANRKPAPPKESPEEVAKRVRALYKQVGRHLNLMAKLRNDSVADRLTDQYFNIQKPYRTNDPDVLHQIERQLKTLRRRIRAAVQDARR